MGIGSRIKAARKAAGLSQEELARRADLSLNGFADIEREVIKDPHYSSLRKIADALGVPIGELLEAEPVPLGEASEAGAEVQEKSAHDIVRDAARMEVERTSKAFARVDASEGIPQTGFAHDYSEAVQALSGRPSDELAQVALDFAEVAVRLEQFIDEFQQNSERLQGQVRNHETTPYQEQFIDEFQKEFARLRGQVRNHETARQGG